HPLSWLSGRILQALGVRVFGGDGRYCWRALCATSRDHQPERVCTAQLDRGRHLGRRGRTGDAVLRRRWRGAGQLRQDFPDERSAGRLALRPGRALRVRDHLPAAGTDGPCAGGREGEMTAPLGSWQSMPGGAAPHVRTLPPAQRDGKILYLENLTVSF